MDCSSPALYPLTGIHTLRSLRGQRWAELVDWVADLPVTALEAMAFTLTVRRLHHDLHPEGDGRHHDLCCAHCASRLVKAFDGTGEELLAAYYDNLQEIYNALDVMRVGKHRVGKVGAY